MHNSKTYPCDGHSKAWCLLVPPFLSWEDPGSIIGDAVLGLPVEVGVDDVKPSRTVANVGFHLVAIQVLVDDLFVLLIALDGENY